MSFRNLHTKNTPKTAYIAMGQTLSLVLGWLYESVFPTLEHEPTTSPSPSPLPIFLSGGEL